MKRKKNTIKKFSRGKNTRKKRYSKKNKKNRKSLSRKKNKTLKKNMLGGMNQERQPRIPGRINTESKNYSSSGATIILTYDSNDRKHNGKEGKDIGIIGIDLISKMQETKERDNFPRNPDDIKNTKPGWYVDKSYHIGGILQGMKMQKVTIGQEVYTVSTYEQGQRFINEIQDWLDGKNQGWLAKKAGVETEDDLSVKLEFSSGIGRDHAELPVQVKSWFEKYPFTVTLKLSPGEQSKIVYDAEKIVKGYSGGDDKPHDFNKINKILGLKLIKEESLGNGLGIDLAKKMTFVRVPDKSDTTSQIKEIDEQGEETKAAEEFDPSEFQQLEFVIYVQDKGYETIKLSGRPEWSLADARKAASEQVAGLQDLWLFMDPQVVDPEEEENKPVGDYMTKDAEYLKKLIKERDEALQMVAVAEDKLSEGRKFVEALTQEYEGKLIQQKEKYEEDIENNYFTNEQCKEQCKNENINAVQRAQEAEARIAEAEAEKLNAEAKVGRLSNVITALKEQLAQLEKDKENLDLNRVIKEIKVGAVVILPGDARKLGYVTRSDKTGTLFYVQTLKANDEFETNNTYSKDDLRLANIWEAEKYLSDYVNKLSSIMLNLEAKNEGLSEQLRTTIFEKNSQISQINDLTEKLENVEKARFEAQQARRKSETTAKKVVEAADQAQVAAEANQEELNDQLKSEKEKVVTLNNQIIELNRKLLEKDRTEKDLESNNQQEHEATKDFLFQLNRVITAINQATTKQKFE